MKLIYAIIRYDNEDDVTTSLTKHKFSVTRLSTTGGFLKKGNTTSSLISASAVLGTMFFSFSLIQISLPFVVRVVVDVSSAVSFSYFSKPFRILSTIFT